MDLIRSRWDQIDIAKCRDQVGGSTFEMILIAAAKIKEMVANGHDDYDQLKCLIDIQNGLIGREYLAKIIANAKLNKPKKSSKKDFKKTFKKKR